MNPYDHYVLPYLIDVACGMKAIQRQRATLVSQARGRVLEIGIGTGRNLPFYDRDKLESLQGLDPAAQMHGLARKRARQADLDVRSAERRVGKEGVRTCRSRWSPDSKKKKKKN